MTKEHVRWWDRRPRAALAVSTIGLGLLISAVLHLALPDGLYWPIALPVGGIGGWFIGGYWYRRSRRVHPQQRTKGKAA